MNIDENIGAIIRARRLELGLNQDALGEKLGVSFQQVQKYERGENALNPARLIDASKALQIPVAAFFCEPVHIPKGSASERETLELIKAFNAISDYKKRKRITDLMRVMD